MARGSGPYDIDTTMDELRYYLELLLDHRCSSAEGTCPECHSLRRIYQFMQTELFSTVIYTETALQPRQLPLSESKPANGAARRATGVRTRPESI